MAGLAKIVIRTIDGQGATGHIRAEGHHQVQERVTKAGWVELLKEDGSHQAFINLDHATSVRNTEENPDQAWVH